jgi:hypothetical protein
MFLWVKNPSFLNCQSDSVGGVYPDLAKILATPKHFSRREAPPPLPLHPLQIPDDSRISNNHIL